MFKYSYSALVYFGEEPQIGIKRVAEAGYDGIELIGEPDYYDVKQVNKLCADYGLKVSSICSIYDNTRDLVHPDARVRANALEYMKKLSDFTASVQCNMMIAQPTAVGKPEALAEDATEHAWAIEGFRAASEYAAKNNVTLCLEPINRYESYMLNSIKQGLAWVKEVGMPNFALMGDTFHMNIEDPNIADAIRMAGEKLVHLHVAETTRQAPGYGHMDYKAILQALKDIQYDGYITFELLPATQDPHKCIVTGGGQEFFDQYTKEAIAYLKTLEAPIWQ